MKKVLIITYYWPPSGGGGVQRWLKFAKYLPEYGWEPIIYTPENPDFSIQDASLLEDVSDDLEVIKLPIWEPYQLFTKLSGKKTPSQGLISSDKKKSMFTNLALWVRGNFFMPDPRRFWVKPSVKFLTDIIERNNIDAIVTTGPPHSMHMIGLGLKKKLSVRWIADFRDPWSKWDMLDNFKLSFFAKKRHQKLELKVLQHANEVVTVSETWAAEFQLIYNREYKVITNGFDEDDFKSITAKKSNETFVISHFGLINDFRNPKNFWKALKEVSTDKKIVVRLYGMIEHSIVDFIKADEVLNRIIDIRPSISHKDVLNAYAESDLLLLLFNDSKNAKGHIPGKLFEYLASKRPILAIGSKEGDASKIIETSNSGQVYSYKENLTAGLQLMFEKAELGNQSIEVYSRKNLTGKLVQEVLNFNMEETI